LVGRERGKVEVEVEAQCLSIEGVINASIGVDGEDHVKEVYQEIQWPNYPGKTSPGSDGMSKLVPRLGEVRASSGIPEANSIIDKLCVVVEVVLVVNEEPIFFSYAIVDGGEKWRRAATHGDAFGLLYYDVVKLKDIAF
jgi:hypothetical protein